MPAFFDTNEPDLILPDERLFAPELLIPNRKPVGPVEINWRNPISEGLQHFWLFGTRPQGIDLVRKNTAFSELSKYTTNPLPIIDRNSAYFGGDTPNEKLLIGNNYPWPSSGTTITYINIVTFSEGNIYILNAGPGHNRLRVNSTGVGFTVGSLGVNQATTTYTDKWTFLAGSYNGATARVFYNGIYDTSSVAEVPSTTNYFVIGGDLTASNNVFGFISYVGLYDRELSLSELFLLDKSPYQLLRPKKPKPILKLAQRVNLSMPEPRTERPAMLIPRRKPAGGQFTIDWDNTISEGLRHFWLFGTRPQGVDLVNKDPAHSPLTGTIPPISSGAALFNGSSHYFDYPGNYSWPSKGTALSFFNCINAASGPYLFVCQYTDMQYKVSSSNFNFQGTVSYPSGFSPDNRDVIAGGTWDGTTVTAFYEKYFASSANTSVPSKTSPITIGAKQSGVSNFFGGRYYYHAMFDRVLERAEFESLQRNPYQLLIPK